MNTKFYPTNSPFTNILELVKTPLPIVVDKTETVAANIALIRFEEKREHHIWAHPDEIIFVMSADHYVRSLIKCGSQFKWMTRHCTIKELLATLPAANFIRLNKFYLLNRNHFSGIDEKGKMLYLLNDFSVPVPHRISRFMLDIIKQ